MVHISEIADAYVKDINAYLKVNDKVKVKVLAIDQDGKISLSIRQAEALKNLPGLPTLTGARNWAAKRSGSFEEALSRFMKESEERQADIKRNRESKRGGGYSRGK